MDQGAENYRRFLEGAEGGVVELVRCYKDGLILYLNAFGFQKTERFFTYRTLRCITFLALMTYAALKSYSFYTGANHIESGIPLGTPGAILSSGFILPLNTISRLYAMLLSSNSA